MTHRYLFWRRRSTMKANTYSRFERIATRTLPRVPRSGGPLLPNKQRGAAVEAKKTPIAGRVESDRLDARNEPLEDLLQATAAGLGS